MHTRPPIPEDIKRAVRRKCGFGCIICGLAFYDYEHDPPYSESRGHNEKEIFLTCPNHHRSKRGLLSADTYERAKRSPRALEDGFAWTVWDAGMPRFSVGNVEYTGSTSIFRVDGELLLGFQPPEEAGAPPRLIAHFYDRNARPVFTIQNNEVIGSAASFDLESTRNDSVEGWNWTVRSDVGLVDLRLTLEPPRETHTGRVHIQRLEYQFRNWRLRANDLGMQLLFGDNNVLLLRNTTVTGPCFISCEGTSVLVKDMHFDGGGIGEISMETDARL